jgi:hypothetical protein
MHDGDGMILPPLTLAIPVLEGLQIREPEQEPEQKKIGNKGDL